jgi:hypothetical protein
MLLNIRPAQPTLNKSTWRIQKRKAKGKLQKARLTLKKPTGLVNVIFIEGSNFKVKRHILLKCSRTKMRTIKGKVRSALQWKRAQQAERASRCEESRWGVGAH